MGWHETRISQPCCATASHAHASLKLRIRHASIRYASIRYNPAQLSSALPNPPTRPRSKSRTAEQALSIFLCQAASIHPMSVCNGPEIPLSPSLHLIPSHPVPSHVTHEGGGVTIGFCSVSHPLLCSLWADAAAIVALVHLAGPSDTTGRIGCGREQNGWLDCVGLARGEGRMETRISCAKRVDGRIGLGKKERTASC